MITTINAYNQPYEFRGLSTDPKPTMDKATYSGVQNGSIFLEMDTGKVFLFNAANRQWVELK